MRTLNSISYSALTKWEVDPAMFYMERLAESRIAREKQSPPAAIGSAFDAYVKSNLAFDLFGQDCPESLQFEPLFEAQVDEHNRFQARTDGQYAFEAYKASGQYLDLWRELDAAPEPPQLELEASRVVDGVPLMGKPDLRYKLADGQAVIFDWKVKSFYSKYAFSPTKGYRLCRDGWTLRDDLPSRSNGATHKLFRATNVAGIIMHDGCMSEFSTDYADQLSMYSWMCGGEVGEPFYAAIDELACGPGKRGPKIRVSELRAAVSQAHQRKLLDRLKRCWTAISTGHLFPDLSLEESQMQQTMLENAAANMTGEDGAYFAKQGRKGYF